MPFFEESTQGLGPQIVREPTTPSTTSFGELFSRAAERDTSIGNIASVDRTLGVEYDPAFDPFGDIEGYEDYATSFADVRNADSHARMKAKIDRERETDRVLTESGVAGVGASLLAGVLDPLNLIPIAGEAKGAYTLGRAGRVLEGAMNVGRAGLMTSVATEGIAQATQETRTAEQSAVGVAATTVLAGVLGGAVGSLARESIPDIAKAAEQEMDAYSRDLSDSVGAARAGPQTTMEQETLSGALKMEKLLKFQDPLLRTTQSESLSTRQIVQDLAEVPLRFKKNEEGIASPIAVETKIKGWHAPLYQSIKDLDDAFVKYRLGRNKRFGDVARIGARDLVTRQEEQFGYLQFRQEVGKALRRGDQSDTPEVAEAARSFRKKVFEPLKKEAIDAGLLPEDVSVDTALSYFTRVYNTEKIVARRTEFEDRIARWLSDEQVNAERALARAVDDKAKEAASNFTRLMPDDIRQIAEQITDTLISAGPGRTQYTPIPLTRGPLKERTLGIPDAMIEDFLESDVDLVSRIYTRTMGADVELAKRFGRADMQDQIRKIMDEYAVAREKAAGNEKELTRLNKAMKADIRDVEAMRDRIRGTYALPDNPQGMAVRSARVARNLNYLRLLGGVTLSSLSDAARATAAHGIVRTLKDGIVPMVRNFRQYRLASEEVKLAGTALDMVLDSRAMSLGEITDQYGSRTRFERGLTSAANSFGMVTLMSPWNAAMKQFAGVVSQTRSLQAIEALAKGAVNQKEVTRLAQFGIGKKQALAIAEQFRKHGSKEGGTWWANTGAWEDRAAAKAYQAALTKEVDKIIITPGQDKPLWMSTELGKVIGQFRSFAISAAQRQLIAGLQERDAAQLNGLLLGTGLGMLTYYLKTKEDRLSDDPSVWVKEGIDRAGVTGWFFDANNIVEKVTRNNYGISAALGQAPTGRYASMNAVGAILGPSFGLTKDALDLTGSAAAGEWSEADSRALRRMIPYQNIFYARSLFDALENK